MRVKVTTNPEPAVNGKAKVTMETPSKERKTKPAFVECAIEQYFGPAGSGATNATYKYPAGMSASMSLIFL